MVNACKDTCKHYEIRSIFNNVLPKDFKKCRVCYLQIKWEGVWCPCCGSRLSSRSRRNLAQNEHRKAMGYYKPKTINTSPTLEYT